MPNAKASELRKEILYNQRGGAKSGKTGRKNLDR